MEGLLIHHFDAEAFLDAVWKGIAAVPPMQTPRVSFKPEDLRIPCSPDERCEADAMHKHLCGTCDTVWKHSDAVKHADTRDAFNIAHTCPKCGDFVTEKFDGSEGPY